MDAAMIDQFRGRWVAVGDSGIVVADSDSLASLHEVLDNVASDEHVVVRRIPARGEPLSVGPVDSCGPVALQPTVISASGLC